jgi:hypothetical protein
MPRPGCVWTHALLIDTAWFEDIVDLTTFWPFFRRPAGARDRAGYADPLGGAELMHMVAPSASPAIRHDRAAEILVRLYGGDDPPIYLDEPGQFDGLIFAIWSQQWPRLRRNFRFQSAVIRGERMDTSVRFDLQLRLGDDFRSSTYSAPGRHSARWVRAAIEDLSAPSTSSPLRRFLWRYGQDVKRQRGSFRPLTNIFVLEQEVAGRGKGTGLPRLVSRAFPELDDAATLKQDLVDGVLLADEQLDLLAYTAGEGTARSFPSLGKRGVARLTARWPSHAYEILGIADRAIVAASPLALPMLETVLAASPPSEFWELTAQYPSLRRHMIEERPELLAVPGGPTPSPNELLELLGLVPPKFPQARPLVRQLLGHNDRELAAAALDRFPLVAVSELLSVIDAVGTTPLSEWLQAAAERPGLLLLPAAMSNVRRTATVYKIAEALGWMTEHVALAGTRPWVVALENAVSDLPSDENITLMAFLIALSITTGDQGAARLFAGNFEPLHDRVLSGWLPWQASEILEPQLPHLGWARDWDMALRLRLAVAGTFVRNNLDPKSFASLSPHAWVQSRLREAASQVGGDKRYTKVV